MFEAEAMAAWLLVRERKKLGRLDWLYEGGGGLVGTGGGSELESPPKRVDCGCCGCLLGLTGCFWGGGNED
jgi:hypothetical protein